MGAAKGSNQKLLDTGVKRKRKRRQNTNTPLSGTQWDPDPGLVSFWCHELAAPGRAAGTGPERPVRLLQRKGMKSVRGQAGGWRVHNMQNGEEIPLEDHAEESIAGELP